MEKVLSVDDLKKKFLFCDIYHSCGAYWIYDYGKLIFIYKTSAMGFSVGVKVT